MDSFLCQLCLKEYEDIDHIFFRYGYVIVVWVWFGVCSGTYDPSKFLLFDFHLLSLQVLIRRNLNCLLLFRACCCGLSGKPGMIEFSRSGRAIL